MADGLGSSELKVQDAPERDSSKDDENEAFVVKDEDNSVVRDIIQVVKIVALVAAWWISAIFVVMLIKVTVGSSSPDVEPPFPYPFALTALANSVCGILSLLSSCLMRVHGSEAPLPALTRQEFLKLMVVGLIQGVEIGCNNKVLEFLTVTTRTMINSTNTLFMMATALCWRLERLGYYRIFSVMSLTLGGICQGLGSESGQHSEGEEAESDAGKHLTGFLIQLTAMVVGSQRWALMQFIMHRSDPDSSLGKMSKLRLMSYIMPVTGTVCALLALLTERDAFSSEKLTKDLAVNVLGVASGVLMLTFAELKLVHLTSAVAVNVLATIHQIPIVLAGVALFGDSITLLGCIGFGLCLGGALLYVAARRSDKILEAAAKEAGVGGSRRPSQDELELMSPELYGLPNDEDDAAAIETSRLSGAKASSHKPSNGHPTAPGSPATRKNHTL